MYGRHKRYFQQYDNCPINVATRLPRQSTKVLNDGTRAEPTDEMRLLISILGLSLGLVVEVCTDASQHTERISHNPHVPDQKTNPHPHYGPTPSQESDIHFHSSITEDPVCDQSDEACSILEKSRQSGVAADQEGVTRTKNRVPLTELGRMLAGNTSPETYDLEGINRKESLIHAESIEEDYMNNKWKEVGWTAKEGRDAESAVKILKQSGDFEEFIENGPIVIVYFYKDGGSEALSRFLSEYRKSAQHLMQYHVLLAMVDCAQYSVAAYCMPDKVNRFAYGFRDGQEKIAFPLDTLFNNNAIVASALHLALINAVPILQTAGERRDLEARCRGRCDIIFSFLHTLGTYEHRMFLEMAYAHQDIFVFAITTYTAGTLGLSNPHSSEQDDQENTLWVVHCADKAADKDCVVSHYRRKMVLSQLLHFIRALQLPIWHELAVSPITSEVVTPYDETGLPWVLLLYDTSSQSRVRSLAPHLAQLLHGSIATITVNLDLVSDAALSKLHLNRNTITAPALAFLQPGQESAALLNDYDDALEWVNEQLTAMLQQVPLTKEEQGYLPVQAQEELQQDDEVVLDMVKEDTFSSVVPLAGPGPYSAALSTNTLSVIAFYLHWDPVSNALLQHMSAITPKLRDYGSHSSFHRIDCFDWPNICDSAGITTYPVLRLHPKGRRNITYEGPINGDYILKTVLLSERSTPVELNSIEELEGLLALDEDLHPACKTTSSAAVGIFPTAKDAMAFNEASRLLEGSHLLGRIISKQAVDSMCTTSQGCVVVSKPTDKFQPRRVLSKEVDQPEVITNFIRHASLPVLAPLDPERFSALQAGVIEDKEEHSAASDQHLIILFLPANSSLSPNGVEVDSRRYTSQQAQEGRKKNNVVTNVPQSNTYDDIWTMIGHLGAQLSEPGFIFSWLLCDEPLADEILPVYGLTPDVRSLVGVNQKKGTVYIFPDFADVDISESTIRDWLRKLRAGHLSPSNELPKREWKPRLPGFDYLKFMLEDQDRDSEDHLILEMEADLNAHHHQGESQTHVHDEL
ncbi:thioredoxin domain-containing protein 16-like [Homarus americanus]|uniref:thioredoxin domain-containing protein 16-like n=1 Tax=Homarus americanus TaxID=6706 RepID=UPI001C45384A|nr:thioredoxin domain-containing protein 16-like [Homarus americanus]